MKNNIGIKLSVSGDAQVRGAMGNVERSMGGLKNAASEAQKAIGPLMGLFTAGAAISKLVAVQREFDVLNSSLKTVTGSSAAAAREMEWLKAFAKETPFGLAQATEGFVKMEALGLDPSRAALTSFGNTASAMGKNLNQMIEAVADASTGEFERLKEFGIKAKKEGDQVSLTFQGVTTTIGNNAREITGYLEALGNNQFAGAMAERANTLDGAIAGLSDTWDDLFRTIGQQNAGTLMHDSVRLAEGAVNDLTNIIKALNGSTAENARQTGAMATVQEGLAVAFESAAVLGLNIKYVLAQVGNELGGLAAQAAAVARLDFEQAAEIGRMMRDDAEKSRIAVEADSARILNARQLAKDIAARNSGAASDPRRIDLIAQEASNNKAAAISAKDRKDAENALNEALKERRRFTIELVKDLEEAAKAEAAYQAAREGREFDAAFEAQEANRLATENQIKTARTYLEQLQFENSLLEMNADQRAIATAMRELESQGVVAGTEAYTAYIDKIKQALALRSTRTAAAETAKAAADEWQKASDQIEQSLTDALMRGFESGKGFAEVLRSTVVNMFKTMVLRPVIQATVQGGLNAIGLGGPASGGSSGGSSGGLLGQVGNAYGIYNSLGSMGSLASSFGAASGMTYGTAAFSQQSVMLAAQEAGFSAAAGASAGSAASSLAAAAPYVAAVLAIAAIADATKGETRYGGQYGYSFDGTLTDYRRGGDYAGAVQGVNRITGAGTLAEAEVQATIDLAVKGINNLLKNAGSTASLVGFQAGLETSGKGRGGVFAGGTLSTGATFGESGIGGSPYDGNLFEKTSTQSPDAQTALANFAIDLQQATIQALQAATDVPDAIKKLVQGVDAEALTAETAAALLQTIEAQISGVNQLRGAFDAMGLQQFADMAFDAASALATASGGFEALGNNLGSYYANFYTQAERTANTTRQITEALAAVGVEMPATLAEYRQQVEQALASGNNTAAAELLKLSAAFYEIETAARAATNAMLKQIEAESATLAEFTRNKSRLLLGLDVPGFAGGGLHSGGLRIVGENGPELEATGPARYWTAAQTSALVNSGTGSADVVAELRALRADVSDLRAEARATASHTARTSRLLDRAMPDGQSIQTTTAPA